MFEEKIETLNQVAADAPIECEKRTYTVNEIQDILGISRVTAYALVKSNVFRSVRVGDAIRISKRSFDTWLDEGCQVCD